MISKVSEQHKQKPAYVYVRQSTMGQVRLHQESTERQYALKETALSLGWSPEQIRTLDRDLGISGAHTTGREDFKTLVADVTMGQVGAVVALEASRLARSSADWHRLIEICALTSTLIIDEDGCYDPADFNDGLLLGLKGTMSQAELHFLRLRLLGGKMNKARKGELRCPLPVGFCCSEQGDIVLDPDQQVQDAIRLVFKTFRETGTAYAVVHRLAQEGIRFPKRSYGGVWNGKMIWGRLSHGRVLGILKNPAYAGAYVFGRYRSIKEISPSGEIRIRLKLFPMAAWHVNIQSHHEGYITWDEYLDNQTRLKSNQTNGVTTQLSGPAREGLALLQGLLLCSTCGRRITPRYTGNGGIYPTYECNWQKREGLSTTSCLSVRCDVLDKAVEKRVLEVLQSAQVEIALKALEELEHRDHSLNRQWQMRIERAEYEAQLAERRYEEVDPSNRLVAANLERRWNEALTKVEEARSQFAEFQRANSRTLTAEQRARILALVEDFPRLWQAPSTPARDRKRMLRLLIKDITVEKLLEERQIVLHLRWQGGASEDITVQPPKHIAERLRYPDETVDRVRELAHTLRDDEIAAALNKEGRLCATGQHFTLSIVRWIRWRYRIPAPSLRRDEELTVQQVAERFGVSTNVVYYWIERGVLQARRVTAGASYWITIDPDKEAELQVWVESSSRIRKARTRLEEQQ